LLVALGDAFAFEHGSPTSGRHGHGRASLALHRDDHGPFTGPKVAFNVKDLLPSAEHGPAVAHGHRQARTKQCSLQMGMAVAVAPGLLVGVVYKASYNQSFGARRSILISYS
jgi:hypothetical protein